jgi:hypothetical protein
MNRRKFVFNAALGLMVPFTAKAQRGCLPHRRQHHQPVAAGGAGPSVWYDIEPSATGDTTDFSGGSSVIEFASITPTLGGTCTKLRIWQQANFGTFNQKLGLWNNDRSLIAGANGIAARGSNGAYIEVTLSTPATVVGGTPYFIGWIADNANPAWYYKTGTGTSFFDNSGTYTYANVTSGALPAGSSLTRSYCVGMWVE